IAQKPYDLAHRGRQVDQISLAHSARGERVFDSVEYARGDALSENILAIPSRNVVSQAAPPGAQGKGSPYQTDPDDGDAVIFHQTQRKLAACATSSLPRRARQSCDLQPPQSGAIDASIL